MSEAAPKVYEAIAGVMKDMASEGISKERNNASQGYKFRGVDDVLNSLSGKLVTHGLCILPRVIDREVQERQSKNGGLLIYTTVTVEYDLVSVKDGSKHTVCTIGEAMDSADKSGNKSLSAAYKYMAFQTFCIPTEGDNDADATTHEVAPKATASIKDGVPWLEHIGMKEEWIAKFKIDAESLGRTLDDVAKQARGAQVRSVSDLDRYMKDLRKRELTGAEA